MELRCDNASGIGASSSDWHHLRAFINANAESDLALATIVAVDGSSYRKAGARLLVNADGDYAGSLSGGCLEYGVSKVALQVLGDGQLRTEVIDTQPHFGCLGVLTIVVEKVPECLLQDILHGLDQRQTFQLFTTAEGTQLSEPAQPALFTEDVSPRPRLIVVGWTSDQEPLFQMAALLGWECIRVVKDEAIASATPVITGERVVTCSAPTLGEQFPPDPQTAVLIMSHHMATDLSFLSSAARENYAYIGLLGSKRRREKLLAELGEQGLLENADWTRNFRGPVGLDIGAEHPSTIALSILAEIQSSFTQTTGLPMSQSHGK